MNGDPLHSVGSAGLAALGALVGVDAATGLLLLVLLSAVFLFSGTEMALFSLHNVDRNILAKADPNSARVVRLLEDRWSVMATLLIGSVTTKVALAVTTAGLIASVDPQRLWLNVLLITPLVVLVADIPPKMLGYRFNREWSRTAAWPLTVFHWLVSPLRLVFSGTVTVVARALGANPDHAVDGLAEEEFRALVDSGTASGEVNPTERDMIEAVFEFDELTVERLMTPRPDIFAVPISIPWNELMQRAHEEGFSRIPVYAARPDDVVGVLLLKDLLRHRRKPPNLARPPDARPIGPRQLRSLLLPPVFVPGSKSAHAMLREFLEKKFHLAFVVDEHGSLMGLVTLDDLLRELVGELDHDTEESDIERLSPETLTVKAGMDIEDFIEETGISIPEGDYHTLGGFVFHQLGRLPRQGDAVEWPGATFTVTEMEGRRIAELNVRLAAPSTEREALG